MDKFKDLLFDLAINDELFSYLLEFRIEKPALFETFAQKFDKVKRWKLEKVRKHVKKLEIGKNMTLDHILAKSK